MAIRITCDVPGHDVWVEFRPDKWTFGDRRAVLEAASDVEWLGIILPYVTGWSLKDVDGAPVEATVSAMDRVEDDLVAWLLMAWLKARSERSALPKAPSSRSGTL
jgi:hypothetical protein